MKPPHTPVFQKRVQPGTAVPGPPTGDEADEHCPQQVGRQSEQGELPPEGQQAEPPAAYGPRAPPAPTARRGKKFIGGLLFLVVR